MYDFSLLIGTIIVSAILATGRTTWVTGAVLVLTYVLISAGFFYVPDVVIVPQVNTTSLQRALACHHGRGVSVPQGPSDLPSLNLTEMGNV